MPELPEVEALVDFLRETAAGRAIARVDVVAVNVLKTFDPPLSAGSARWEQPSGALRVGTKFHARCRGGGL